MKNIINLTCILRAIALAGGAALVSFSERAEATPVNSPEYTVNGATVTASGVNTTTAYFLDTANPGVTYSITVNSGANLGNTTGLGNGSEIEFTNGSVNNLGSLLSDSAAGILIHGIGSVTNNGTISAGEVGIAMGNGYVINAGSISGVHGAGVDSFVQNNGTTGNSNAFSLTNNSAISSTSGEAVLVQANNENNTGTAANSNTVTISNAATGTLMDTGDDAILINALGNSNNTSTGANSNTLSIANAGTINAGLNGIELQNITNAGNVSNGTNNVNIANSGNFTTTGDAIKINMVQNKSNSGAATNTNTVAVTNTGVITTGDEAIDLETIVNSGNGGSGVNNVTIANSAAINSTTAGDQVVNINGVLNENNAGAGTNTIKVTNSAVITANDGAGVYIIAPQNEGNGGAATNTITFTNSAAINTEFNSFTLTVVANDNNNGNALTTIAVNNSAALNATNGGGIQIFKVQNTGNNGTGTNTIGLTNSGTLQVAFEGLQVSEISNAGNANGGINTITVNNSGDINALNSVGMDASAIANTSNTGNGVNTVTVSNTGSINAGMLSDLYLVGVQNASNTGVGTNTVIATNSGNLILATGEAVELKNVENNSNTGLGVNTNTVSLANNAFISVSGVGLGMEVDQVENSSNTGNGINNVIVANSGAIGAGGAQAIVIHEVENNGNLGSGPNTNNVGLTNSGTLIDLQGDGIDINNVSNSNNTGTAASTNNVTLINTQVIFGGLGGINISAIQNQGNHGDGINTVAITNTAEVDVINGNALHIDTTNSANSGAGTNKVSVANSGFLADGGNFSAIDVQNENSGNTGTGLNSNSLGLTNTGTVATGSHVAINLLNNNVGSAGNASNSISIYNSGVVVGTTASGMNAINESTTTAGNNTQSITFVNSGTVYGLSGDAVDLGNTDAGTTGTSINTIKVLNGSTGNMLGISVGLNIENPIGVNNTVNVTNAGEIGGGTYGIMMGANNASIVTEGGEMFGNTDAIKLQGTNSNVTILGRTQIVGVIEGNSGVGNTLTFDLSGMTSAQIAAAQTAIANAHGGAGQFAIGTYTYSFDGFLTGNIIFNGMSFQRSVDSGLQSLAAALDSNNANLPGSFDLVYSEGFSNPEATLNQLSGREFLNAFSQIGLSNATQFASQADTRAFSLRQGSSGIDFSALNVNPSTMIASLGNMQGALARMSSSSLWGGVSMSDSKDDKAMVAPESSRWGVWAAGTVTFADESNTSSNPGYNSTSGSPTFGIDYRVCPELVVGALFNYTTGNVNFADGSNLNTDSYLGGIYIDWTHKGWFVNGLAAGGVGNYDQNRVTLGGAEAQASPSGSEELATISGGYDFKVAGMVLSPEAGLQYTHLNKDAFSESGAGIFDLNVGQQNVDSLRSKIGLNLSRPFTFSGIKWVPQANAFWYHEFLDETNGVNNSLPGAPALGSFVVQTNPQGRDFALVGAGVTATPDNWHGNVSFFANYEAQVGQTNFMSNTVDGGIRIGF